MNTSMNRKTELKNTTSQLALAATGVAMLLLSACSKDKTLDEWKRERTAQEVAKIEAVSGNYSGTLTATGEPMAIELRAGTRITSSIAGASSDRQGTLTGKVTIDGESYSFLTFDQGFFDVDAHDFKIEIPVTQRNGSTIVIEISGNANGGELNGRIEARGFSELSGAFRLKRVGAAASASSVRLNSVNASKLPTRVANYTGTVKNARAESFAAEIVIMSPKASVEQLFLDRFTPVEWVDMTFVIDGAAPLFSNSQWDHRRGILSGERAEKSSSDQSSVVFECVEPSGSTNGAILDCRYVLNRVGVLYQGRFERSAE